MQTIAEMIAAAQERRAKQIADLEAQKRERRQEALDHFRGRLNDFFGELSAMFDMSVRSGQYDDTEHACFTYQERPYRLGYGRNYWYLTRLEERAEGDDRELPHTEVYASYHNSVRDNQDNFLLALVELSECPDTPRRPAVVAYETPEPTIEERLVEVLRDFIRAEVPNNTEY